MGGVIGKISRLSLSEETFDKKDVKNEGIDEVEDFPKEFCFTPKKKLIAEQLLDPRSATVGIKRTPLILVRSEENEKKENETPVKPKPYLETDLDEAFEADESFIGTEQDPSLACERSHPSVNELAFPEICHTSNEMITDMENDKEEELSSDTIVDTDSDIEIINIDGKITNSPAVLKTKITGRIYEDSTPTSESTPVKPKNGRTPLSVVNSSPLPSPLGGGKPWRGFHEERMRLGLENTPPSSGPFFESVQSAPSKVGARRAKKWSRANWAQDESLVI